jgi:LPS sulfotransferase NodH
MSPRLLTRLALTFRVLRHGERAARPPRGPLAPLTPEEVAEAQTFFPLPKFFILGHARSGTTLLMRLANLHPDVLCNRQAHFFTRRPTLQALTADPDVADWLARGSFRWNRGRDISSVVQRAAADYILERDARRAGKTIVGDKSPNSLLNGEAVRRMHDIYPDAKLIFIVRDGRDAALSHRFQSFIDATQHLTKADWRIRAEFERDPQGFRTPERSLFTEKGIRAAAHGWAANVSETHALGQELYRERYHALKFEDLLADPVAEMLRVWNFLGADTALPSLPPSVLDAQSLNRDANWQDAKAGEIADAIPKGQSGSWQEYFSDRDKRVFDEIAGETLKQWGYRP